MWIFNEINEKTLILNNFICFIAFKIYKYKMFCRVTNEKETLFGIQNYIKRQTKLYYYHGGGGGNFHYKGIYRCAAGMGYTFQASQYMNGYHFYIKSISMGYLFHPKSI